MSRKRARIGPRRGRHPAIGQEHGGVQRRPDQLLGDEGPHTHTRERAPDRRQAATDVRQHDPHRDATHLHPPAQHRVLDDVEGLEHDHRGEREAQRRQLGQAVERRPQRRGGREEEGVGDRPGQGRPEGRVDVVVGDVVLLDHREGRPVLEQHQAERDPHHRQRGQAVLQRPRMAATTNVASTCSALPPVVMTYDHFRAVPSRVVGHPTRLPAAGLDAVSVGASAGPRRGAARGRTWRAWSARCSSAVCVPGRLYVGSGSVGWDGRWRSAEHGSVQRQQVVAQAGRGVAGQ